MEPKTEGERAAEDYGAALEELDSITKVDINALTMLAEDNKEYAVEVAACIENRLKSAPNNKKLPILYLIDSICKNFSKSLYVQLFTQNIVSNFCNVFEVSPERTRRSLHKLRMTWDATKTFPQKKLNAIDERVHEIDPNWPVLHKIAAAQSQAKSQNQKQQQLPSQRQHQKQEQQPKQQLQQEQQQALHQSGSAVTITNKANGLRNKQPKARPVKRIRNNNTHSNLGSDNKVTDNQNLMQNHAATNIIADSLNPQPSQPQTLLPMPGQQPIQQMAIFPQIPQPMLMPQQNVPPQNQLPPQQQPLEGMYQLQVPYQPQTVYHPQSIAPVAQNPPLPSMDQGLYVPAQNYPPPTSQSFPQQPQQSIVDNRQNSYLSLPNDLDITLNSLYGGKQCSNCSLRFDDNNKYAIHLDWHFRQNFKSDNMFARRKWYYPLDLWIQFREINDDEIQESNNSDSNNVNDLLISHNDHEVPTAPASTEDEKNICSVCHETFEKFWAEEEEEWRLRNARLHDDQRVYHPLCLMDMLQTNAVQ